jgi:hypothetical protein
MLGPLLDLVGGTREGTLGQVREGDKAMSSERRRTLPQVMEILTKLGSLGVDLAWIFLA